MRTEREFRASRRFSDQNVLAAFAEVAPDEEPDLAFAKSPKTVLQLRTVWRAWQAWCEEIGHEPMPVAPRALKAWVAGMANTGKTPATISNYVACLSTICHHHGYELDRTPIRERMKAVRRRGRPPRRAAPLMTDVLASILDLLDPSNPRDCRDGALMTLMFGAALRSAEATTLDWARLGPAALGGLGWAAFDKRGTILELGRSKTAQVTPVEIVVPDVHMPSLRRWLRAWLDAADVRPGQPIFRPISRWGHIEPSRLASESVTDILRARVLDYARAKKMPANEGLLLAARFSSHSCRRGYCSSAANRGIPLGEIRARSRHSSDAQLAAYIESASSWRQSGLRRGVGV